MSCAQPSPGGVTGRSIPAALAFAGEVPFRGGSESGMSVKYLPAAAVHVGSCLGAGHGVKQNEHFNFFA